MPRLLLVEDEIGALAALRRGLTRAGFEVLVATNLPDALSATEHERPDAVLVAAGLQGETAASIVEQIRTVDIIRPVIVMGDGSGTGEPSLPRPVDQAQLLDMLKELLPQAAPAADEFDEPTQVNDASGIATRQAQTAEALGTGSGELARRRELAAKALAEAQARRRAAEAMRSPSQPGPAPAPVASAPEEKPATPALRAVAQPLPAPLVKAPAPIQVAAPRPTPPADPTFQAAPPSEARKPTKPLLEDLEIAAPEPARKSVVLESPQPAPRKPAVAEDSPLNPQGAHIRRGFREASTLGDELFGDEEPSDARPFADPPAEPPRAQPKAVEPPRAQSRPIETRAVDAPPEPVVTRARPEPAKVAFPPEGLEVAPQGSLEQVEPATLILACFRARMSGQLRLDQGPVQRTIYFDEGRIAGAGSTSPEERLEALSYRRGFITREQQRQLRAETQIPTRRLALMMVERSYLKPAELFPLVQERVEEIIYEACGGFVGTYAMSGDLVPDEERVALPRSPLSLTTEGIRRKYLMDRVLAGLGGPATLLRPARVRGPEFTEFGLAARERRLGHSVDGLRNVEELLFENGIEPLPGLKILYSLLIGRAVEIAVRGLASDTSPEVEDRIDLRRVAEKYAQVRSANYFEVLGVSPTATGYEIGQAYERLSREFQPGRFRELRRPELPGQLDEIQRVLAEARDILVDDSLREEYRSHLRAS